MNASSTEVLRIAAFSDGGQGGNPAGVWIGPSLPEESRMQRLAHEVGFSETAFAAPVGTGAGDGFRVRYFSPEAEVAFCGHATIALGAALARQFGDGVYPLALNEAAITVEGRQQGELSSAALQSPPTRSAPADPQLVAAALKLFGYTQADLNPRIPPGLAHAGNDHLVLALASRELLAAMRYELEAGRALMAAHGLVTIVLAWAGDARLFHTRNAFAIDVVQGEDMGMRSLLHAGIGPVPGSSIRVAGTARFM